jgi:hypothetical protein
MYSTLSLEELLIKKTTQDLIFIHTPKCGGTYVGSILKHFNILNKVHKQAIPNEGITFTVIREPIERFESFLNYKLGISVQINTWPSHLHYIYRDKTITLNEIVSKMTDDEILSFIPFRTLTYWTTNVDIIITLDKLPQMLEYFGYTYDLNLFQPLNISRKIRGKLNHESIQRLQLLYKDDIILYNKVLNSQL